MNNKIENIFDIPSIQYIKLWYDILNYDLIHLTQIKCT